MSPDSSWCWATAKCAASGGHDFAADLHPVCALKGRPRETWDSSCSVSLFLWDTRGGFPRAGEVHVEARRGHGSREGASSCTETRRRGATPGRLMFWLFPLSGLHSARLSSYSAPQLALQALAQTLSLLGSCPLTPSPLGCVGGLL